MVKVSHKNLLKNNMKNLFQIIIAISAFCMIWWSCKKDKTSATVACSAGKGGSITIVAYAKHSGVNIINSSTNLDTTYIKFSATTSPGLSQANYDTFYIGEQGEDHIHCAGLKCGDYFLYRTAYDTTTMTRYSGSQAVNIIQTSGEKDVVIDVN